MKHETHKKISSGSDSARNQLIPTRRKPYFIRSADSASGQFYFLDHTNICLKDLIKRESDYTHDTIKNIYFKTGEHIIYSADVKDCSRSMMVRVYKGSSVQKVCRRFCFLECMLSQLMFSRTS